MKQVIGNGRVLCQFAAAFLAFGASAASYADLTDVVFRMTATAGTSTGVFEVTQDQGAWNGDEFIWSLSGAPVTINDQFGQPIATLSSANVRYVNDPIISMGFNFDNALGVPVIVEVNSGLLSFADQAPAQGTATAGITVTDNSASGDGVAFANGMTGVSGLKAYQANINGLIPAGTQFAELVNSVTVVVPGGSNTGSENTGGLQPIAGSLTSMSSQFRVSVSALDSVSGTSNFRVIPEPTSLALLLIALAFVRRR